MARLIVLGTQPNRNKHRVCRHWLDGARRSCSWRRWQARARSLRVTLSFSLSMQMPAMPAQALAGWGLTPAQLAALAGCGALVAHAFLKPKP